MAAKKKVPYPQVQRFKGIDGQWYWRCCGENGWTVTVGGEGFTRKRDVPRAVKNAAALLADAVKNPIVDVKEGK